MQGSRQTAQPRSRAPQKAGSGMTSVLGGRRAGGAGLGAQQSDGEGTLLVPLHPSPGSLLTGLRAAAGVWAARAADVAAAAMGTALAPADAHQDEEEEDSQDHQAHKHPLWKDVERPALKVAHLQDGARQECVPEKGGQGRDWEESARRREPGSEHECHTGLAVPSCPAMGLRGQACSWGRVYQLTTASA